MPFDILLFIAVFVVNAVLMMKFHYIFASLNTHTHTHRIYGPNSEIEWNQEGSRGFLIINRKPSQTALSAVADSASELGDSLNRHLKSPSKTNRSRTLSVDNDATSSDKIILTDPINVKCHQIKPQFQMK